MEFEAHVQMSVAIKEIRSPTHKISATQNQVSSLATLRSFFVAELTTGVRDFFLLSDSPTDAW
jgi:hypothetical protein